MPSVVFIDFEFPSLTFSCLLAVIYVGGAQKSTVRSKKASEGVKSQADSTFWPHLILLQLASLPPLRRELSQTQIALDFVPNRRFLLLLVFRASR